MAFRAACFDRSAVGYENQAWIQTLLAERVLERCAGVPARRIFESGCGTGILTRRLERARPEASIVATDFSRRMLAQARSRRGDAGRDRVRFVQQDAGGAEPPVPSVLSSGPYDLAVSNALVQWLPDLRAHLAFTRGLLTPQGAYVFSTFRRENLPELNALLAAPPLSYSEFPGWEPPSLARAAEEAGFEVARLDQHEDVSTLPTPLSVLRQLQAMGASRDPRHGGRLTRARLRQLLACYAARHAVPGGVSLTWRSCVVVLRARAVARPT
jgi:SAM-dependent methyltransferase